MAYHDFNMDHQWLPFTPNRQFKAAPRLVVSAEGVSYRTADGRHIVLGGRETKFAENLLNALGQTTGPIIAVSDNMRLVPEQIAKWFPERFCALGTDGFGRSESREALRKHFEIDGDHVAFAALSSLHRQGQLDLRVVQEAVKTLNIDTEQPDPVRA